MNDNKETHSVKSTADILDQQLTNRVASLTDEMTPERDLWLGIERAISQKSQNIEQENTGVNFVPVAWAASFVMVILLSWLTFTPQIEQPSPQIAQLKKSEGLVSTPIATEQLVNFMQSNFQQQKKAMLVSFGQPNLAQLPAAMQKELTQLAAARESIRQALLKDENNVDLLNLLDFTQQQELKLLAQLYQQYQMI